MRDLIICGAILGALYMASQTTWRKEAIIAGIVLVPVMVIGLIGSAFSNRRGGGGGGGGSDGPKSPMPPSGG